MKQGSGDRFARKFPKLFNAFVAEPLREEAVYILNKQGRFSCLRGSYRPTVRAPQERTFCDMTLRKILYSYHGLSVGYHNDVVGYLTESFETSADKWWPLSAEGDIIAAAIDLNHDISIISPIGIRLPSVSNMVLEQGSIFFTRPVARIYVPPAFF